MWKNLMNKGKMMIAPDTAVADKANSMILNFL